MPIYDQSYRSYDGQLKTHFRWAAIVEQELRILFKRRMFYLLMMTGLFHLVLRILLLYIIDVASRAPGDPLSEVAGEIGFSNVGPIYFLSFIQLQMILVFIIMLYAGSGLICNDVRNNLMEIYFSKPITWRDYVVGKLATLVTIGFILTAVPAYFLLVLHNLFLASTETLVDTAWYAVPITAFSLVLIVPTALAILASSSLVNSPRMAAIALFLILFTDTSLGGSLAAILEQEELALVAFPATLYHLGEILFRLESTLLDASWHLPALFALLVSLGAGAILSYKVRQQEIAI